MICDYLAESLYVLYSPVIPMEITSEAVTVTLHTAQDLKVALNIQIHVIYLQ